ncbi:hypothetical protein [Pseudomonas sp. TMP9]|uniref:hypothetical protein n=1 Tax=unclassified Pseudomonas TaxID=196821 RepID=UPI0030D141D1
MHRFGYAYSIVQNSAFALLLLSTGAQAELLFAPQVFITAPQQAMTLRPNLRSAARSGLQQATLQPVITHRQPAASRRASQWLGHAEMPTNTPAALPPRLRF